MDTSRFSYQINVKHLISSAFVINFNFLIFVNSTFLDVPVTIILLPVVTYYKIFGKTDTPPFIYQINGKDLISSAFVLNLNFKNSLHWCNALIFLCSTFLGNLFTVGQSRQISRNKYAKNLLFKNRWTWIRDTLCSYLNVKELLARNRRVIWI